ncbi:unnamed protein product [Timema podura]|uniref:Uncharacterized protein n=1 Tax=Timema podura TaxID=61482 RepID=A0ABN7NSH3_TIMPD|nr:unnamed protein product [Timema podura]
MPRRSWLQSFPAFVASRIIYQDHRDNIGLISVVENPDSTVTEEDAENFFRNSVVKVTDSGQDLMDAENLLFLEKLENQGQGTEDLCNLLYSMGGSSHKDTSSFDMAKCPTTGKFGMPYRQE